MKPNFTFFLLALAVAAAPAAAQTNNQPVTEYRLDDLKKTAKSVVIAGDPQLAAYAIRAFSTHGAFMPVAANGDFTLTFTPVSAAQVRVDIAKKGSPTVTSITASGAAARDALYRAADAAVKNITGAPGYFTSRLAFVSKHTGACELYIGELFLSDARAITGLHANDIMRPHWSPDGHRIIFTSDYKSGSSDIFQIDVNTRAITDYAIYRGTNMGGCYSPDGARTAMVIGIPGGNLELYTGTPDGRGKPARITTSPEAKASPCFSPDGQRIVFAMEYGSSPQLYIMPAKGGAPTRISTGVTYSAEPDWSRANPNLIVFTTNRLIGVHDLSTGKTRLITPKTATGKTITDAVEPSWLPDGRHVVFTHRPASGGQRFLYILDTDEKSDNRATQISTIYARQASVLPQP